MKLSAVFLAAAFAISGSLPAIAALKAVSKFGRCFFF
jgi:hypothetical protein